jgi:hypothetical protein
MNFWKRRKSPQNDVRFRTRYLGQRGSFQPAQNGINQKHTQILLRCRRRQLSQAFLGQTACWMRVVHCVRAIPWINRGGSFWRSIVFCWPTALSGFLGVLLSLLQGQISEVVYSLVWATPNVGYEPGFKAVPAMNLMFLRIFTLTAFISQLVHNFRQVMHVFTPRLRAYVAGLRRNPTNSKAVPEIEIGCSKNYPD